MVQSLRAEEIGSRAEGLGFSDVAFGLEGLY